ncbi:hypothetical protein HY629_00330 [Candidatus Uhrbacteria bacterium]|nr:hypothetical protein [Candidatus Uhrbacteria bacterium]
MRDRQSEFPNAGFASETPDATLRIHRNDLQPEVRAYADNLRDQVRDIWQAHGVRSVDEFETAARAKRIPRAQVKEVHDILERLHEVVEGKITPEILAQLKEQEYLKEERLKQAKTLFDKGWGEAPGYTTLDQYLDTIPDAPPQPEQWKGRFDRLVLVDDRIPLTKACQLAELKFDGDDQTFVQFDSSVPAPGVYWIYANDGRQNSGLIIDSCRAAFRSDERGLTAIEGISLYIHDSTSIQNHTMDLTGSVRAIRSNDTAFLGDWGGGPQLEWRFSGSAILNCGTASRGEFSALPTSS